MKKILLYGMVMILVAFFASCQQETQDSQNLKGNGFYLNLSVQNAQSPTTRSTVDPIGGEEQVNSLYLLFFEYSQAGTGKFLEAVKVDNPVMNQNTLIDFSKTQLNSTTDYSILAFANVAVDKNGTRNSKYLPEGTSSFDDFMDSFDGMIENDVTIATQLFLQSAGTNEADDSHAIDPAELVMSARVVKQGGEVTLPISLTRAVSRFDVIASDIKDNYEIKSVSIWNAAVTTPLWVDRASDPKLAKRLYGLKYSTGVEKVVGGLYTFENIVAAPQQGDEKTTCIIVGLNPKNGAPHGTPGTTMYYRVNISPEDGGQSLRRNFVYRVNISMVKDTGFTSEGAAYQSKENQLVVNINNWGIDTNGVVDHDGTHMLGLPFKRLMLSPDGEERKEKIFILGPESSKLRIDYRSLPTGLNVSLVDDVWMVVTATPLASSETERRGSVTFAYGNCRLTMEFLQSRTETEFLELNKTKVDMAPSQDDPIEIPGGRVVVTSSGPWKATIYNLMVNTSNPGFSFKTGALSTDLKYEDNNESNEIAIYTTGINPYPEVRRSFVIISLASNESINRTLLLEQAPTPSITVSPNLTIVKYTMPGAPEGVSGAKPQDSRVFKVEAGTNEDGTPNELKVEITGTNANKFDYKIDGGGTEVRVWAVTNNDTNVDFTAKIKISVVGAESTLYKEMDLVQDGAPLELKLISSNDKVPAKGNTVSSGYVQYRPERAGSGSGATYTATIISNSDSSHKAFFIDGSSKTESFTAALGTPFAVSFDKIYFPIVGKGYTATVSVAVDGGTPKEVVIEQEALVRRSVSIGDVVGSTLFGTLSGGSRDNDHYFGTYRTSLFSSSNFGSNGRIPSNNILVGGTLNARSSAVFSIPSQTYNYIHVGSRKNNTFNTSNYSVLNNWRINEDGIMVYVQDRADRADNNAFNNTLMNSVGLGLAGTTNNSVLSSDRSNPVMKFICNDGPFGTVSAVTLLTSGAVTVTTNSSSCVPVIRSSDSGAPILTIDPVNKFVFIGECQFFHTSGGGTFLQNLQAFIVLSAQYGSHFLDIFDTSKGIDYPFSPTFVYP